MPQQIQRTSSKPEAGAVTFATTIAGSTPIGMTTASAFAVYVPAGQPTSTITWYASYSVEGPWAAVVLSNGSSATTSVVADKVYISPPELFPCPFIKGVGSVAVSATLMMKG